MGGVSSINSDLSFTGKVRSIEPLDVVVEEEEISLLVVCDYGTLISVMLKQHNKQDEIIIRRSQLGVEPICGIGFKPALRATLVSHTQRHIPKTSPNFP